jgi:hypothetical protein
MVQIQQLVALPVICRAREFWLSAPTGTWKSIVPIRCPRR